jgi:ABC-2 type transport system permease protein
MATNDNRPGRPDAQPPLYTADSAIDTGRAGVTAVLVRKLLRDVRTAWILMALFLFGYQILFARVAPQVLVQFQGLGLSLDMIQSIVFQGPGKVFQALMGLGEVRIDRALDLQSIAYVHPLTQIALCVWAIGRAAGAIVGEIDRGTMELLLAQPMRRRQLIGAHLIVEATTIAGLTAALFVGTTTGVWLTGFITAEGSQHIDPLAFLAPQLNVALFLFAMGGVTIALSAAGRSRNRVLGVAVFATLVQFLVNVLGQLWSGMEPLRPFTLFYYYQPQPMILHAEWYTDTAIWLRLAVLGAVGSAGYLAALWVFCRRDIPAPL